MNNLVDLTQIPTAILVKELRCREGVVAKDIDPYERYMLIINDGVLPRMGPEIVLIVED